MKQFCDFCAGAIFPVAKIKFRRGDKVAPTLHALTQGILPKNCYYAVVVGFGRSENLVRVRFYNGRVATYCATFWDRPPVSATQYRKRLR